MKHYKYGSSTAARTDACQAWTQESEGVPRKESQYAMDGTITHGVLEAWALDEPTPDIIEGHRVNEEHLDMAREMWALTQRLLDDNKMQEWEPEVTAHTSELVGGTLDLVARGGKTCMLIDYKTGMGVQVEAVGNKQLLFAASQALYGDSPAKDLVEGATRFIGVIIQPDRGGNVVAKEWPFTLDEVCNFWQHHQANIELAEAGDQVPKAGDHCRFCPANGLCAATTGDLLRMSKMDPADLEQLKWGLDHLEQVKHTIAAIEKAAYEQLELGGTIPGWKLVMGRAGATAWDDEAAALKLLKKVTRGVKTADGARLATLLESRKVITPTQAKALLKKHQVHAEAAIDEHSHCPAPKTMTLAREDDPREAVLSADALQAALNSVK